jgi:pimeloyl-ACP methyl ester carboxylesterase
LRGDQRVSWLRFPTLLGGAPDTGWARVIEPVGVADPPTLVFLHGIAVESEFWRIEGGRIDALTRAGLRIVRPEAPWHGRRRPEGWFGGEPALARGPLGMLDLFEAWVGEVASLIDWARATSRGGVAVGGVSLGALTSQMVGVAARHWPAAMRPDTLFLVATSGDLIEAAVSGGLARRLGAEAQLASVAWTPPGLRRWSPLLEPEGAPAVPPERIVMLIGTSDNVTPFRGGKALAERWALPEKNLFMRPQGHFSLALGLEHDAAPLSRLVAALGAAPPLAAAG